MSYQIMSKSESESLTEYSKSESEYYTEAFKNIASSSQDSNQNIFDVVNASPDVRSENAAYSS